MGGWYDRFWLPAAIGAALANRIISVVFSGSGMMMNIQEMATASENQLDVKIILMNNEALGLVHQQSLFYECSFLRHLSGQNQLYTNCRRIRPRTQDLNNQ